jgi:hypothetical protein
MRKLLTFAMLLPGIPCVAQVTGGRETVQDAIRFERQKDASAARQARIERRQAQGSTADRSASRSGDTKKQGTKSGSSTRTEPTKK